MKVVTNLLLFKITWFAGLFGAGSGIAWLGAACLAVFVFVHVWTVSRPIVDLALISTVAIAGFGVDTLFAQAGVLEYSATFAAGLAPLWIAVLWANFALTLNHGFSWLKGRYLLAALVGLVCGPFAYFAGVKLGAAEIPGSQIVSYATIGIAWALFLPVIVRLAEWFSERLANARIRRSPLIAVTFLIAGCQPMQSITTVDDVDIERFMGDWYVIAAIPIFTEKDAYNSLENYALNDDGTIATTYTFNKGALDGPLKTYRPKGFVSEESTGLWGMQFFRFLPLKSEYRIIYLTDDYTQTVIGRSKRDYVWIMAREKSIPEDDLEKIKSFLVDEGYDLSELRMVPHG